MVACILFVLAGASDAAKDLGTSIVYVALFLRISASAHSHAVTYLSLVSCRFCYGIGKSTSRLFCVCVEVLMSCRKDRYTMVT